MMVALHRGWHRPTGLRRNNSKVLLLLLRVLHRDWKHQLVLRMDLR